MSKENTSREKVVKFTLTDGRPPTRNPVCGTFNLRAPLATAVQPGTEVVVRSGVFCDHPVHVFEKGSLSDRGGRLVDGVWAAHDSDRELTVRLRNVSESILYIEDGDVIARFAVFDNSHVKVV